VLSATFGASVGLLSPGANVFKLGVVRTWALHESAYLTMQVRSSVANAAFRVDVVSTGGVLSAAFTLPVANVWYLVRATGQDNQTAAGSFYFAFYPTDASGATVSLAKVALIATQPYDTGSTASGPATTDLLNANAAPGDRLASYTWDPASIAAGASLSSPSIAVNGTDAGDVVTVVPPGALSGLVVTAQAPADDTVIITLMNPTGAPVDLASGAWTVRVAKPF
jgi:hypothetical protein